MSVEFIRLKTSIEGEKRMHLPYRVVARCPNCDAELVHDLAENDYLGYPPMNGEPFHYDFYCDACCGPPRRRDAPDRGE